MDEVHQRICYVRISDIVFYLTRLKTYVGKKRRLTIYYTDYYTENFHLKKNSALKINSCGDSDRPVIVDHQIYEVVLNRCCVSNLGK